MDFIRDPWNAFEKSMLELPSTLQHLIRSNEPLAPFTWLGIGGPARFFAEPTTREELLGLIRSAYASGLTVRILGGGSNLLVRESGVDGLVLSLSAAAFSMLELNGQKLRAGGGAKLSHVVTHAAGNGLAGMETLAGIPGTVGGAVIGNAGAAGFEIAQLIDCVELVQENGEIETRSASEIRFSHRHSDLESLVLLSATFELEVADALQTTQRTQQVWITRRAERPAGETRIVAPFIEPDGISVASLIEQLGLKGARRGGAELDTGSPAYLIARPGMTSDDVLGLLELVKERVQTQTGIDLQLGIKIW